jgi:hypothetical protein
MQRSLFKIISLVKNDSGFSVIEVLLAAALFIIFSSAIITAVLQGFDANRLGNEETIANEYSSEGIEAVRSIKNQAYSNIVNSAGTGVIRNGSNVWAFSGANNTFGKYTRVITVADVQRDGSGNIVAGGGGTVGLTTQGSTQDSFDGGFMNGSKYTTGTTAGSISSLSVYVGSIDTTPNNKYALAIYTDSSGNPGSLVAQTATGTLTANSWNTLPITATLSPSTSYWFFYETNSSSSSLSNMYYNSGGSTYGQSQTFGSWPASLTNPPDTATTFSIYATFGSGTIDPNTKKITSTVSWNVSPTRNDSIVLSTYLTNWRASIGPSGGMLAYADTVVGSNAILTKTFTASTNTWSSASTLFPDGTVADTNALQVLRIYASKTRNEKIIISRHSGTSSTIYASVWNGTSWTKQTLATWGLSSVNDFLNFDGTYLNNGDFMVVYYDGTTTPKFRTWNGTAWSAQLSVGSTALTGSPNWIVVSQRPGTNQVMAVFLTTSSNTQTYYYNGSSTYAAANWGVFTTHSTLAPSVVKKTVDFVFSPNTPTTGALIYADSATDKNLTARIFVASGADGAGTGTWGTAVNAGTAQTNNVGTMDLEPRPNGNEFHACNKDAAATPTVVCNKITFSGSVPTIAAPVIVAAATDTGNQRSFDIDWKSVTGDILLNVYADNTAIPKFKKFAQSTATWDASATSITTTGSPGVFKSVRIIPKYQSDDMLVLMADANLDVYSIFFNGTTNTMYTTPAALAFTSHGVNGVATANFWYDFAWDQF